MIPYSFLSALIRVVEDEDLYFLGKCKKKVKLNLKYFVSFKKVVHVRMG